jgi:pimeloyl-ACP methyl ester carboxylesterase
VSTQFSDAVQGYRPLSELVPAHWQTGSIEAHDGARIHYTRTGGQKPPVLLLHGVQVNGLTWLGTAKALEATYDVVMPDFRGHGLSSRLVNLVFAAVLFFFCRSFFALRAKNERLM